LAYLASWRLISPKNLGVLGVMAAKSFGVLGG
jgi:hypothetical protein